MEQPHRCSGVFHSGKPLRAVNELDYIEGARLCSLTVLLEHRKIWGRMAKIFLGSWWESRAKVLEVICITGRLPGSEASVCGDIHSLFW